MLFGDKEAFAVEAYLSQRNSYVFINYCFWVKNDMVGDLEQDTLLSSVIPIMESILALKEQRRFIELEKLKDFEIISYFINVLWGSDQKPNGIHTTYTELDIKKANINSQEGEAFQGFYTFLLEYKSYDFLLCKEDGVAQVKSIKIPKGLFYKIIKQTLDWIRHSTMLALKPDFAIL